IGKLPVTDYEVILFVNGSIKASLNVVKVFPSGKPTLQNFKLTGQYAANKPAKKHTHMVYVPAETGSNLSGRWVEVDDIAGSSAAAAGTGHVDKGGNAMLRQLQSASGSSSGGN